MLKRILVPLDPSSYTKSAMEVGCYLSKLHNAELTGVVVLDTPGIMSATGPTGIGAGYYGMHLEEHREKDAQKRIDELLTVFRSRCEQCGINHCEMEFQGKPSFEIANYAMYFDAVIMGMRTHFNFETSDKPGDTLSKVLGHSITPVYAVPENVALPTDPDKPMKVVVAFDGSMLAARALQHFAQLWISRNFEIVLVISSKDKDEARYHLAQANSFLHAHGITNVKKIRTDINIIRFIDDEYMDWADGFVVGAHAKKGIVDFMVGSLTKHLIKENKKPVLIG